MAPPPPVVVVGDLMTDVVARVGGPLAVGSDTDAEIRTGGGGSAANTACWLAAAGVSVTLVARRGADLLGTAAEAEVRAAGVLPRLTVDPLRRTGACVVLVDVTGERTMLPDRGANLALTVADLPDDCFQPGAHLHVSGYVVFDAATRPVVRAAVARARGAGMTWSIDPASAAPLAALGAPAFLAETAGADVCLPNTAEASVLTGCTDPRAAARELARHYGVAVVTLGASGALACAGDRLLGAAAPTAGDVIDTTGAGDAFAAGFLARWLADRDVVAALAAGVALATRAVAQPGGRP